MEISNFHEGCPRQAEFMSFEIEGFRFWFHYHARQHKYEIRMDNPDSDKILEARNYPVIEISEKKGEAIAEALHSIQKTIEAHLQKKKDEEAAFLSKIEEEGLKTLENEMEEEKGACPGKLPCEFYDSINGTCKREEDNGAYGPNCGFEEDDILACPYCGSQDIKIDGIRHICQGCNDKFYLCTKCGKPQTWKNGSWKCKTEACQEEEVPLQDPKKCKGCMGAQDPYEPMCSICCNSPRFNKGKEGWHCFYMRYYTRTAGDKDKLSNNQTVKKNWEEWKKEYPLVDPAGSTAPDVKISSPAAYEIQPGKPFDACGDCWGSIHSTACSDVCRKCLWDPSRTNKKDDSDLRVPYDNGRGDLDKWVKIKFECMGLPLPTSKEDPKPISEQERAEQVLLDKIKAAGGEMDTLRMYSILEEDLLLEDEEATDVIVAVTAEHMEEVKGAEEVTLDLPGETFPGRFRMTGAVS